MSLEIKKNGDEVSVTVTVKLAGSMNDMEVAIQSGLNGAGCLLTGEALSKFDTQGQPLKIGNTKFTAQQKSTKQYETPYGRIPVARYVYQTSKGGKTYCPLDDLARIIISSTPRFAQMIASKYANSCAAGVKSDLDLSNGRNVSRSYIQDLAEMVGEMALAEEVTMDYEIPKLKEEVTIIAFSLDGTCMLMKNDGYREAMTGSLSLYNAAGDRLHTIYLGAAPQYGKEIFLGKLEKEINKIKKKYPRATYVGLADGAACNWTFLNQHTTIRVLDFYHATEYLSGAADAFGDSPGARKVWLSINCHNLKHDKNGAKAILKEMIERRKVMEYHAKSSKVIIEKLDKAITYFTNQLERMNYFEYRAKKLPIGSGVTEAACKTLIKQRLCNSMVTPENRTTG